MTPVEMQRFARDMMNMGEDSSRIVQQLVDHGVEKREALRVMEQVSNQMLHAPGTPGALEPHGSLAPALVGGLLAAVVGGGAWALISIATGYETGFVAWGIGALCGFAVLLFSRKQHGPPLQVIAAVCSLLGILVGKYGIFFLVFQKVLAGNQGEELASKISIFSPEVLKAFADNFQHLFGGYDLLWIVLAVATAWGIPKAAAAVPDPGSQT